MKLKRSRLTKAEFLTLISSDGVWLHSMSESNIRNGYRACGIFPVDREAYPKQRFSPKLLERYETWLKEGRPDLTADELDQMYNAYEEATVNDVQSTIVADDGSVMYEGMKGKFVMYFIPENEPSKMIKIPDLKVLPQGLSTSRSRQGSETPSSTPNTSMIESLQSSSNVVNTSSNDQSLFASHNKYHTSVQINSSTPVASSSKVQGFKSKMVQQFDRIQVPAKEGNGAKHRKGNPHRDIVTGDKCFEELKQKHEAKVAKSTISNKQKQKQNKKSNLPVICDEDESEDESDLEVMEEDSSSIEVSNESNEESDSLLTTPMFPPVSESEGYEHLKRVWSDFTPPITEESLKMKFFAAIYYIDPSNRKKPKLFIGRIIRRFLSEAEGSVDCLELDCLELAVGSPVILSERLDTIGRDIGMFSAFNIIAGPLDATLQSGKKWMIPDYPNVVKTFKIIKKLDRQAEFRKLY